MKLTTQAALVPIPARYEKAGLAPVTSFRIKKPGLFYTENGFFVEI
jgi:hypothetical protein